eukprot:1946289-Alexandrium_andersonii.AAC.1
MSHVASVIQRFLGAAVLGAAACATCRSCPVIAARCRSGSRLQGTGGMAMTAFSICCRTSGLASRLTLHAVCFR